MKKSLVIEKGVPISEVIRPGKWRDIAKTMNSGESVWVKTENEARMLYRALLKQKGHPAIRMDSGGYRVWRFA